MVSDNFDRAGRLYKQGALRWFSIDGRTGPPKMSERDIEARVSGVGACPSGPEFSPER